MKPKQLLLTCFALQCCLALAEDAYYYVPLTSLALSEGKLPTHFEWNSSTWKLAEALKPYPVIDGEGEGFVSGETLQPWSRSPEGSYQSTFLTLRAPKGQAVTGRLFLPKPDFSGMVALKFKLEPVSEKPDSKPE